MPNKQTDLLSTREAASLLGVSLRTIQLWVESGVLRAWKTAGGHRRVSRDSVDKLLQEKQHAIQPEADTAVQADKPARKRVLIIEDEPDLLKLYRLLIGGWGLDADIVTACNGFEGLVQIGQQRPDIVITDLMMPGMDGFAMLRSLNANADFNDLHTIVVTAMSAADVHDQGGLPEGCTLMHKPLDFTALRQHVESWLSGSSQSA